MSPISSSPPSPDPGRDISAVNDAMRSSSTLGKGDDRDDLDPQTYTHNSPFSLDRLLLFDDADIDFSSIKRLRNATKSSRGIERLTRRNYTSKQNLNLSRAHRRTALARERLISERLRHTEVLEQALQSENEERDQYRHTIAAAHAIMDALFAEKKLNECLVSEAVLFLRTTQDRADKLEDKLTSAQQQLAELMGIAYSQRLPISSPSPRLDAKSLVRCRCSHSSTCSDGSSTSRDSDASSRLSRDFFSSDNEETTCD